MGNCAQRKHIVCRLCPVKHQAFGWEINSGTVNHHAAGSRTCQMLDHRTRSRMLHQPTWRCDWAPVSGCVMSGGPMQAPSRLMMLSQPLNRVVSSTSLARACSCTHAKHWVAARKQLCCPAACGKADTDVQAGARLRGDLLGCRKHVCQLELQMFQHAMASCLVLSSYIVYRYKSVYRYI